MKGFFGVLFVMGMLILGGYFLENLEKNPPYFNGEMNFLLLSCVTLGHLS